MFYKIIIKDHIRVPPSYLQYDLDESIKTIIAQKYSTLIDDEIGFVIDVGEIKEINDGVLVPGDGSAYFDCEFELFSFKPIIHEITYATVQDITEFGAFLNIGPVDGMVHISQTMDDFVSFNKNKSLFGKDTKRNLKIADKCKAKIIAVSYKDPMNPRIGLTMRKTHLGKDEWFNESVPSNEVKKE